VTVEFRRDARIAFLLVCMSSYNPQYDAEEEHIIYLLFRKLEQVCSLLNAFTSPSTLPCVSYARTKLA